MYRNNLKVASKVHASGQNIKAASIDRPHNLHSNWAAPLAENPATILQAVGPVNLTSEAAMRESPLTAHLFKPDLPVQAKAQPQSVATTVARQQELAKQEAAARQAALAQQKELARLAEVARQAEIARLAEAARLEEVTREKEVARQAEITRLAEVARQEKIVREAEAAHQAEIAKQEAAVRQAELARHAEVARQEHIARQKAAALQEAITLAATPQEPMNQPQNIMDTNDHETIELEGMRTKFETLKLTSGAAPRTAKKPGLEASRYATAQSSSASVASASPRISEAERVRRQALSSADAFWAYKQSQRDGF